MSAVLHRARDVVKALSPQYSLRARLVSFIVLLLVIIVSVESFFLLSREIASIHTAFKRHIEDLLGEYRSALADWTWGAVSDDALRQLTDQFINRPSVRNEIAFICIFDNAGQPIHLSANSALLTAEQKQSLQAAFGRGRVGMERVRLEGFGLGDTLVKNAERNFTGHVYLGYSKRWLEGQVVAAFWRRIGFALVVLILGVAAALLVGNSLTKPIHVLVDAAHRVEGGDLDVKVQLERRDELKALADAFNAMTIALKERQRLMAELQLARDLQTALLPRSDPDLPAFEVCGISQPASEVGGDYYDYFFGRDAFAVALADVSGTGMQAAMLMAVTSGVLRGQVLREAKPSRLLSHLNRVLCSRELTGMFVSLCFGVFDSAQKTFTFASAGQTLPMLYRARTRTVQDLTPPGRTLPLGIMLEEDSVPYDDLKVSLEAGDVLVFFTDGVVEAMNARRELYGFERLAFLLHRFGASSAQDILNSILDDVRRWRGRASQNDDITLVVVKAR